MTVDDVDATGQLTVPDTGGYETFQNVSKGGITLNAGPHAIRLFMDAVSTGGGAGNFDSLQFSPDSTQTQDPTPYGRHALAGAGDHPGRKLRRRPLRHGVLRYDVRQHGNVYRTSNVDISALTTGGGYYVGWTRASEWLRYTTSVQATGSYTLDLRIANKGTGAKITSKWTAST